MSESYVKNTFSYEDYESIIDKELKVPVIGMVRKLGILIFMNVFPREHNNPPHIHAMRKKIFVRFNFDGSYVGEGFAKKQIKAVQEWIIHHLAELEANWALAEKGIKPLRLDEI